MKIASRVLGLILGFAGLVFIAIAVSAKPESVLAARDWRATWSAIAFAVIFLLGAWYFLWLDVDALEDDWDPPPNAFVRFIFLSRRALAALAMFGCVGEFVVLVLFCFGVTLRSWVESITSWGMLTVIICSLKIARPRQNLNQSLKLWSLNSDLPLSFSWALYAVVALSGADILFRQNATYQAHHQIVRTLWLVVSVAAFGTAASFLGQTAGAGRERLTQ